ncbi:hypothetical protein BDR03DRAFT_859453, partial [Suillus americanus]
ITTALDWLSARNRPAQAYRFAFLHRTLELDAYGNYTNTMFYARATPSHFKIINLDKAIRKRVGSCRNLELSNFEGSMATRSSYFSPYGRNYNYLRGKLGG